MLETSNKDSRRISVLHCLIALFSVLAIALTCSLFAYYSIVDDNQRAAHALSTIHVASCQFVPKKGFSEDIRGSIRFSQQREVTRIVGEISGLEPGSQHALEVLEYSDSYSSKPESIDNALLEHFNPTNGFHGCSEDLNHNQHAGDIGNVVVDDQGVAKVNFLQKNITVPGVVGRLIVLSHSQEECNKDDQFVPYQNIQAWAIIGAHSSDEKVDDEREAFLEKKVNHPDLPYPEKVTPSNDDIEAAGAEEESQQENSDEPPSSDVESIRSAPHKFGYSNSVDRTGDEEDSFTQQENSQSKNFLQTLNVTGPEMEES